MNRTFVRNAYARSVEFLSAPPAARGHWFAAQNYVSEREAGGLIAGCRSWRSRQWKVALGPHGSVAAVAAMVDAHLATWRGNDLQLSGYDLTSERNYQRQREGGRRGGLARAENEREQRESRGEGEREVPDTREDDLKEPSSPAAEDSREKVREVARSQAQLSPSPPRLPSPHGEIAPDDAAPTPSDAERIFRALDAAVVERFGQQPYRGPDDLTTLSVLLAERSPREILAAIPGFVSQAPQPPDIGMLSASIRRRASTKTATTGRRTWS